MDLKTIETLHGQYETLKTTLKSDKIGTETEPIWDYNPAKLLFNQMVDTISECLQNAVKSSKEYHRLLAMKGVLHYQHAKVLVQLKQMSTAQEILKTCFDFLKESFLEPEVTFLGLRALNHYCYLLTKSNELDKSQKLLEFAEAQYLELKQKNDLSLLHLYGNDELFEAKLELTPNKDVNEKLERLVTNNLQMLGYVYNKKGDLDKFAMYHHQVLKRQLDMREGDATVWAIKTARLGYFFLTRNKFAEARHHLAAACYVLTQYENTLKTLETTDLVLSKWDELNHRYADIAKCWVRYGLFLFNASKMKLVSAFYGDSSTFLDNNWVNLFDNFLYGCNGSEENEENSLWNGSESQKQEESLHNSFGTTNFKELEKDGFEIESPTKKDRPPVTSSDVFDIIYENSNPSDISIGMPNADLSNSSPNPPAESSGEEKKPEEEEKKPLDKSEPNLRFSNLNLNCFENLVSCNYVDNLQSARELFLFTHSWLKKSKLFYTLKDHPMEYVNVILDLSELYRYLAFFEEEIENFGDEKKSQEIRFGAAVLSVCRFWPEVPAQATVFEQGRSHSTKDYCCSFTNLVLSVGMLRKTCSQYSVQKRRADTLETLSALLKEARPQCYLAISIELFRELAEIHLELMGLNLRRLYLAQPEGSKEGESKSPGQCFTNLSDFTFHKMEAVADVHRRLYQFSEIMGHGALGDFQTGCAVSSVDSDITEETSPNLFETYQTADTKLF